jgi:hypothetical protein
MPAQHRAVHAAVHVRREETIMTPQPATSPTARLARVAAATAVVCGLAALVALESDRGDAPLPAAATVDPVFLRAPAIDPSLPAAERVFASQPAGDDVAPPTF